MIYFDKNKCVDKLLISYKKKAVTITGNSLCLYRINTPPALRASPLKGGMGRLSYIPDNCCFSVCLVPPFRGARGGYRFTNVFVTVPSSVVTRTKYMPLARPLTLMRMGE